MTIFRSALLTIVGSMVAAVSLVAQDASGVTAKSNTRGPVLGAHVLAIGLAGADHYRPSGGENHLTKGAGAFVGYGFTSNIMLYLAGDASKVTLTDLDDDIIEGNQYTLTHLDLGVRYSFANTNRSWVPYLNAAVTQRQERMSIDYLYFSEAYISYAATFGGGVQRFLFRRVALDLSAQFSTGKFSKVQYRTGSEKRQIVTTDNLRNVATANSTRVSAGIRLYPLISSPRRK